MTKIVENQVVCVRTPDVTENASIFRIGWMVPSEPCGDPLTEEKHNAPNLPRPGLPSDCFYVAADTIEEAFAKAKSFEPRAFNLRYTTLGSVRIMREVIGA